MLTGVSIPRAEWYRVRAPGLNSRSQKYSALDPYKINCRHT